MTTRISLVTLGCARNEVDSEELAARFEAAGLELVEEPADADAVVVNTCGFVEAAKKDSVDTLLAAADLKGDGGPQAVIAVGCLAQRYGGELAESLPEADAVLGFDDYPEIAERVRSVLAGVRPPAPVPTDRRLLLPLAPAERPAVSLATPGHAVVDDDHAPASGPRTYRRRLDNGPMAPLKIASGCDRRCSFCAIPSFRGAFISRSPDDIVNEARWLAESGVSELFLVSENSTSYGKDLGDLQSLERLLPRLAAIDGVNRVRVSYLQPAEMRPGLIDVMTSTEGVAAYFDLSFQHSSGEVLRRMRRFGDTDRFLELVSAIRERAPLAGIRSNVIVGFPGESEADVDELQRFLEAARLDVVGVFGYSDEDGTTARQLPDQNPPEVIAERLAHMTGLVDDLMVQRAEDRLAEQVRVLIEEIEDGEAVGRAEHQGPEVDGTVRMVGVPATVGSWVDGHVVGNEGVDLVARQET